jgi:septal ring factor EnvC (AmiA/AmiB activator)
VADLKSLVAERQGVSTAERFIIVVNGKQMENSMTVADLIASSKGGHVIRCWQRADPVAAPTEETDSADSSQSVTSSESSTGCSSDLYGGFAAGLVNAPTGRYDAQPTNAQLVVLMQQMQQQMQQVEAQQHLIMEQHEAEISSLRTSMARVAENPTKIHITLQRVARGFFGRQRCKRIMRHVAVQCQSIGRGGMVRRELSMQSTMATRIETVWRSRSQCRVHAHTLKSMLSLQRIIRGWLGRQQVERKQHAAIRIAAAFRCHTARLPEVHGRLHREKTQLDASKVLLEAHNRRLTSELEQRSAQKEHYQQKHNELLGTIDGSILSCPITHQQMVDPVLCTADGYRYERAAITQWINSKGTSPMTRTAMSLSNLIPDCPKAISDWHAGTEKRATDAESKAVKVEEEQRASALAKEAEHAEALAKLQEAQATARAKVVRSALRALQEKIRRLESERDDLLDECIGLKSQLRQQQHKHEHESTELQTDYKNIQRSSRSVCESTGVSPLLALQEEIRRLESERSDLLDECVRLKLQLRQVRRESAAQKELDAALNAVTVAEMAKKIRKLEQELALSKTREEQERADACTLARGLKRAKDDVAAQRRDYAALEARCELLPGWRFSRATSAQEE